MSLEKRQEKFDEYCKTVQVCPDFNTDVTVSPFLFGNNLEHTRSCIYNGISAQMLKKQKICRKTRVLRWLSGGVVSNRRENQYYL